MTFDLEKEVEFLRDQVYRLNSALAYYQSKYPSSSSRQDVGASSFPFDGELRPEWLTDKRTLWPLVSEYDAHVNGLKKQIAVHEEEEKHLGKQIQKLIEENQRLTSELKEQVQLQLDSLNEQTRDDTEDGLAIGSSGFKYQEIVNNLEEQLSICVREKDHVDGLLQDALAECDRMAALNDKGLKPLIENLEMQCGRKIESYGRSIAALNTEANRGKLQLNEKQNQLEAVEEENANLRKDLDRLKLHLDRRTEELEIHGSGKQDLQSLTQAQEEVIQNLTEKHRQLMSEFYSVSSEKQRSSQSCIALQDKISQLESHHAGALEQLKSNVQLVENVLLDKDQAVIRAKQLEEETQMLKASLQELVAEAGERTKRQVEEIRNESTAKMTQMSEFVGELEEELRSKTSHVDRLKRQLGEEGPRECVDAGRTDSSDEAVQSLKDELHLMELKRDEVKSLLAEALKEKSQMASTHEQQRDSWKHKESKLNLYIEDLMLETDKARAEKVEVATEKESLQALVTQLRVDASAVETRLSMRDSSALESLAEKEASFRSRLDAATESHRDSVQALRDAISRKDILLEELRKDLASATKESESHQSSSKSEREESRRRIAQLGSDLREERALKAEVERRVDHLETRLEDAERRRRQLEAERDAAQKTLLDKITAEKNMLTQIDKMEKDFQRVLISRVKERDGPSGGGGAASILGVLSDKYRDDLPPAWQSSGYHQLKEKESFSGDHSPRYSLSSFGSISAEQLTKLKGQVNEDLKRMFTTDGESQRRRRKKIG